MIPIEQLNINIELFFEKLATGSNKKELSELDREIICQSLLGNSRQHIAKILNSPEQKIRDRLSNNIYPRIAELMQLDQEQIAGNWVKLLNLLLHCDRGYKLNTAPQLNNDNFQGSFGRQIFLYPPNQDIVELQIQGTKFYQQGLYYQALKCFIWAGKKEREIYHIGNPEVLIYINNCLNKCLIAGSATFYHENVLHWIDEQSQYNIVNPEECQILACVPWHWHSQKNGCNSDNQLGQRFCQTGTQLWGEENLTWRSATAFDSVLIIIRILEICEIKDSQSLLINMNKYFKEQKKQVKGVTGNIEFQENGDRLNPPTEIVALKWNAQQQKWQWTIENRILNSEWATPRCANRIL